MNSALAKLMKSHKADEHGTDCFLIGGRSVSIFCTDVALLALISHQLGHLRTTDEPLHKLHISRPKQDIDVPMLFPGGYSSSLFEAFIDFHSGSIVVTSIQEGTTLVLIKSPQFRYDRPHLIRTVLQAVARKNVFALHGGVVAWGDSPGLLLSAKGGSGKSTAVVAAVSQGAKTIGDDFVLGEFSSDGQSLIGWSMFSSVRLEATSPARPLFDHSKYPEADGKEVFNLEDRFTDSMRQRIRIGKLVVPCFSKINFTHPISRSEAMLAIAPSSVGLSLNPADALASIGRLVGFLPSFKVGLTPDISLNAAYLRDLSLS
jgi:hypothetical protein